MGKTEVFMIIVSLVFMFVVLAISYGGLEGEGLAGKTEAAILGAKNMVKDLLPTYSFGLEEQKAEVTVPDVHRAEVFRLRQTISGMLGAGKENCFANYGGLSEIGDGQTSLAFAEQEEKTVLTVSSGAGGKQIIADLSTEFPGMKPCVIAGTGRESENFFKHFLEDEDRIHPYFSSVTSLELVSSASIIVPDLDLDTDLDDKGWLFTPDGEHICFFPTNVISDYAESGIDNNYFTDEEENSIPNRINGGKLLYCN